jgi:hypothetical protein
LLVEWLISKIVDLLKEKQTFLGVCFVFCV